MQTFATIWFFVYTGIFLVLLINPRIVWHALVLVYGSIEFKIYARDLQAQAHARRCNTAPHRLGLSSLTIVSIKVGSGSSAAAVDRRIGISLRVHIPRVHLFQAMF